MNKILLAALGVVALTASAWAQTPPAKPDEKTLSDAYTYLLGRVLVIRQEHMDRRRDGFAFNTIKYNPLGSADFVNPNFDVAPNAAEMQQKVRAVAAYLASSKEASAAIDAQLRPIIAQFRADSLTKTAPYINHWLCANFGGNYGASYRQRTAANYAGICANSPSEVVYFADSRDANEQPLSGSNSYVMHFAADRLPDSVADAYWSVILVGVPDFRVVPNALNRYNFNNHSPLQKESDGSLKIAFGPKPVSGVPESNWLPSPAGKPFSLTFRAYVPREAAQKCEWTPPSVTSGLTLTFPSHV